MKRILNYLLVCTSLCLATHAHAMEAIGGQQWHFRVFLDEKLIGSHEFTLEQRGDLTEIHSEASFEYKLLFVKLYEYQHQNLETWQGDCLLNIESETDANGKAFAVSGQREAEYFQISARAGESRLPPCVMSFAYWNPDFLEQQQLLNSQTGDYVAIDVKPPEYEKFQYAGQAIEARRYELEAGEMKLALWYSEQDDWLALETEAAGGRVLRYERMP